MCAICARACVVVQPSRLKQLIIISKSHQKILRRRLIFFCTIHIQIRLLSALQGEFEFSEGPTKLFWRNFSASSPPISLSCATKNDPSEPSKILAYRRDVLSRSPPKKKLSRKFHRERQRANTPLRGARKLYEMSKSYT